jgi:glutathione S-transferase
MMKLIQNPMSPYSARVRIAIYAKALEREVSFGDRSAAGADFRRINPTNKVPVLQIGDDYILESEVIIAFLEETHPSPSLLPADPIGRARVRTLARFGDLYIDQGLGQIIPQLIKGPDGDRAQIAAGFEKISLALSHINALIQPGAYAYGSSLSIADCALAPLLWVVNDLGAKLGQDPFESAPNVRAYFAAVRADAHVGRVLGEMDTLMAARMKASQA